MKPLRKKFFFIIYLCFGMPFLIGLGVWQFTRLGWKKDLIAAIQQGQRMPVGHVVAPYHRFQTEGTLTYPFAVVLAPLGPKLGYGLFVPLQTKEYGTVWTRLENKEAMITTYTPPTGRITVTGVLRPAQDLRGFSVYTHGVWLRPAIHRMNAHYAVEAHPTLWLDATQQGETEAFRLPPNHHLQYALTWWALAIVGAIIYGAFCL